MLSIFKYLRTKFFDNLKYKQIKKIKTFDMKMNIKPLADGPGVARGKNKNLKKKNSNFLAYSHP